MWFLLVSHSGLRRLSMFPPSLLPMSTGRSWLNTTHRTDDHVVASSCSARSHTPMESNSLAAPVPVAGLQVGRGAGALVVCRRATTRCGDADPPLFDERSPLCLFNHSLPMRTNFSRRRFINSTIKISKSRHYCWGWLFTAIGPVGRMDLLIIEMVRLSARPSWHVV